MFSLQKEEAIIKPTNECHKTRHAQHIISTEKLPRLQCKIGTLPGGVLMGIILRNNEIAWSPTMGRLQTPESVMRRKCKKHFIPLVSDNANF